MTNTPWRVGDAGRTIFGPPNGQPAPEVVANVRRRTNATAIVRAVNGYAAELAAERALSDALADVLRQVDILLEGRGVVHENDIPIDGFTGCAPMGELVSRTLSAYDSARKER